MLGPGLRVVVLCREIFPTDTLHVRHAFNLGSRLLQGISIRSWTASPWQLYLSLPWGAVPVLCGSSSGGPVIGAHHAPLLYCFLADPRAGRHARNWGTRTGHRSAFSPGSGGLPNAQVLSLSCQVAGLTVGSSCTPRSLHATPSRAGPRKASSPRTACLAHGIRRWVGRDGSAPPAGLLVATGRPPGVFP